MIQYIKRKELEVDKYNACIENSIQSRIYAFSWYLDIVADHWDVLVLDDYKAVMPIPWKRKYGIKYVTQPYFCQQLGIFSLTEISENIQQEIISKIPNKFLKVSLNLNSKNSIILEKEKRINFILSINKEYSELRKSFSKGRKHAIKVGEKQNLEVKNITIKELIEIQQKNYTYKIPESKLLSLEITLINKNIGTILGVFKNDTLLGGGFFIKFKKRIIYLYSAFTQEGREYQASSFLISHQLKENKNALDTFDFEGGNIPNIGKFYKSFGAEEEVFSCLKRTFL